MRFDLAALLCAVVSVCGCDGCTTAPKAVSPSCLEQKDSFGEPGTVSVRVETIATGLEVPWGLAFLPSGNVLVTERPGRVRLLRNRSLRKEPVVTVPSASHSESGLLGIALHPRFSENRLFYVYYTREDRDVNRVERYRLADDDASATRDRVIVDEIPSAAFHDGGRIHFGPDGMLYVGTGDARNPDDAQSLDSTAGKILRLTSEGAIPTDNPWRGKPYFAIGVRNTQAFDWIDAKTMVMADHGPSGELSRTGHDEVNVVHAGDDLGWPVLYGCEARRGMVSPLLTFRDAVPPGGAVFYTHASIAGFTNSLLIGTLKSKHLHRVTFDSNTAPTRVVRHEVYFEGEPPSGYGRLREVAVAPDGSVWVTTSNCDGRGHCPSDGDRILRITS